MDSDDYFEDTTLNLDDAALQQLDAIESAAFHAPSETRFDHVSSDHEDSFADLTLNLDVSEVERLDNFIEDTYEGRALPIAGPSRSTRATLQTTLFGDVLPAQETPIHPRQPMQRKPSSNNPFGKPAPKTKTWDHTAFAKSGLRKSASKSKGKQRWDNSHSGDEEDEEEFEQFPAPFVPPHIVRSWPPAMKLKPDLLEARHWIYPLNRPKRDYQFNIVKKCLFENSLVALPTGLGKTFIAGVIMLNYYRWFPDGKVVFIAPTKPLVAQQVEASHQACGIPGTDAIELTGENAQKLRAKAWEDKRVFYMTAQTFIHDLQSGLCDPLDIILLVIDEAHRGTGNHAYAQVVRYLTAKNPHFRLLALTATPGGTPDKVQDLVDGLHISHIEIRDENSLDLRPFIHEKRIEQHIIEMNDEINRVMALLAKLMESLVKPLRGIVQHGNVYSAHPFYFQSLSQKLGPNQRWAFKPLFQLSGLARAMGYLQEASISMCYNALQSLAAEDPSDEPQKKKATAASNAKKLRSDPLYKELMTEFEAQKAASFTMHPKLDRLKTFLVQHFAGHDSQEEDEPTQPDKTRAMVFVTFRECVGEIVDALNFDRPLLRAAAFIGQATDKQGNKGLAQKDQLGLIQKFKAGEINILVATSIGEEGLDIGEVDLIVCYDAQKTPIRMLQRIGRTGRKRSGCVHVLLAKGREEQNFDKAKDAYAHVQKTIWSGADIELYGDVGRLLPDHVKPQCLEREMEIIEYVRTDEYRRVGRTKSGDKGGERPAKAPKRKRNDAPDRNIPQGAITGFLQASKLTKRKKITYTDQELEDAGRDNSSDLDIASGLILPPRRTQSSMCSSNLPKPHRMTERATTTVDKTKTKAKPKPKKPPKTKSTPAPGPSHLGSDDDDHMDQDQHTSLSKSKKRVSRRQPSVPIASPAITTRVRDPPNIKEDSDSDRSHTAVVDAPRNMAWLMDGSDDDPNVLIVNSSPRLSQISMDDSIEFGDLQPHAGVSTPELPASKVRHSSPWSDWSPRSPRQPLSPIAGQAAQRESPQCKPTARDMPPPPFPSVGTPTPSFPVRPVRRGKPLSRSIIELPSSSPQLRSPAERRLRRFRSPSPTAQTPAKDSPEKRTSKSKSRKRRKYNPLFDMTAEHSGEEVSEGSSNSEDDVENEYDRDFIRELATQAPPSYDQSLVYRQSLMTQAPGNVTPLFKDRPVRRGAFGPNRNSRNHARTYSSPQHGGDFDDYEHGSFVVDDDAELLYSDGPSFD